MLPQVAFAAERDRSDARMHATCQSHQFPSHIRQAEHPRGVWLRQQVSVFCRKKQDGPLRSISRSVDPVVANVFDDDIRSLIPNWPPPGDARAEISRRDPD